MDREGQGTPRQAPPGLEETPSENLEEIPEWALRPSLRRAQVEPEVVQVEPMLKAVRVHMSPTLRTDVSHMELMVRLPFSGAQLRDRVAELLAAPHDRTWLVR